MAGVLRYPEDHPDKAAVAGIEIIGSGGQGERVATLNELAIVRVLSRLKIGSSSRAAQRQSSRRRQQWHGPSRRRIDIQPGYHRRSARRRLGRILVLRPWHGREL